MSKMSKVLCVKIPSGEQEGYYRNLDMFGIPVLRFFGICLDIFDVSAISSNFDEKPSKSNVL